jgi:uncharacterized protein
MCTKAIAMNGLLDCEYFDIESAVVEDTYRIFVAKPPFMPLGTRCPAIYTLDGNSTFSLVMGIQRTLAWGAEAPAAYVIGVGYPTENGFLEAASKRNRDYPPTDGGEYGRAILGLTTAPGAAAFHRFLSEELRPALDTRYAIDHADATLIGHSLGGLFGAWALLTMPSTFRRYILGSPTISWNSEEVWQWEQQCADTQRDLSAEVFLSAGELETPEAARRNALHIALGNPMLRPEIERIVTWYDQHGWPRTAQLAPLFAEQLRSRNFPSLRINCDNMSGETHLSVVPAVISRGLRFVFGHCD